GRSHPGTPTRGRLLRAEDSPCLAWQRRDRSVWHPANRPALLQQARARRDPIRAEAARPDSDRAQGPPPDRADRLLSRDAECRHGALVQPRSAVYDFWPNGHHLLRRTPGYRGAGDRDAGITFRRFSFRSLPRVGFRAWFDEEYEFRYPRSRTR